MFWGTSQTVLYPASMCLWFCEYKSPFVICIISTPSLSVLCTVWLAFMSLKSLSPVSADMHLSSLTNLCTPSVTASGSQNMSLGVAGLLTSSAQPLGSHKAVTLAMKLCLSFCVLLFLNTGALITVQKLILTARLVTPSVPLALPFQLWKRRMSLKCIDYRLQYGNSNMETYWDIW